jgi:hypothetical protein
LGKASTVLTQKMIRIADLWKLQEIDIALDASRASLSDARERLGESEELIAARALAADLAAELRHAQAEQKDIELEADDLKAKLAPVEKRLYDGSVRNPKELTDLQADLDQLKKHLSAVEDRDLDALAAFESVDAQARAATADLAAIESAWNSEQAELVARLTRLTEDISQYEAQREVQRAIIDSSILATYDNVRRMRNGRGVARLDRNLCTGCRISLPVNLVTKARAGNSIVQCPTCERILYV